ncbi:DUF4082 domain-containing protein [Solirubrobacter ginsenosidimutans]|uniref:DUF4082 domain-containing protein n=1 Tax=Solirubrobacter ginsenosidimutans TaxID=490573 RepID=A0A9X3N215_9ACTN|nr:DUF4082 domain-containing protein [Solirubrobacter ginsenosidimutans]MDA0166930.1 DUF4082 domain-containing protein [Solirubrobacter ginsenosidimutans]
MIASKVSGVVGPSAVRRLALIFAFAVAALAGSPVLSQAAAACGNPISCENEITGTDPSVWEVEGSGDPTIQGFATSMSVNKGENISFKIKSSTQNMRIDIYRLGYYNNMGARLMQGNIAPTATVTNQPACQNDSASANPTGLVDCGNWSVSYTWAVPSTAVSGVYIAHLERNDTNGTSLIPFVVRDDSSHSDVVVQTSDATWQAYNTYGGNSLYTCTTFCPSGNPSTYKAAYKVSYNRPFHTADDDSGRSWLFAGGEYQMIRFLERNGYDTSYVSSLDVGTRAPLLKNHELFISSGHDEYWSASQRTGMEQARDAGVNLAFFTGNEGFWKTRWEPSMSGTANRTLVSYKDTHFPAQVDPVEWTGTWRDPRFTTAAQNTPENALTGQSFIVNSGTSAIEVPQRFGTYRMWKNTTVSSATSTTLAPNSLGYEWDEDADNGYRPAGQIKLSATTVGGLELFTDYGSTTAVGGTATHNMTMYKAPSGARVFSTGTVQWAWGLDDTNPNEAPVDKNMQQATVNVLADLDAGPADTLMAGLSAATKTTDATPPTATINTPPATVPDGTRITLSGTATDAGGGVVAGVEISTDGGASWHPTSGTTSWSYSWIAHGSPTANIKVRATDDSANTQTPGAGVNVNVTCPCSIWGANFTPADIDSTDATPAEVGVKFKSDQFGQISGIRFYKVAANTGTHVGSLWSTDGTRLAQATFSSETASGWQTVTFSSPVQVMPNTTYIASYFAPNGHFAATGDYFYRAPAPGPNGGAVTDGPPLHAIKNTAGVTNGVYVYSGTSVFPSNSFGAANYWVDVLFAAIPAPGAISGLSATAGGKTSANLSWTAPSTGGAPTSYKITPYIGATAQTPTTISGTPPLTIATITGLTTGTAYTFTVQAINPTGSGPVSANSNAVTPLVAVPPSPPTNVVANPASNQASVSWTIPQSDGDSPITNYTITPYIGATAQTATQVTAPATSAVVTGLTNGVSYTFKVTATNAAGTGTASASSAAVTPEDTILDFATPTTVDSQDGNAVELGVKFKPATSGQVTGIRFYKSAANTGIHSGSLWSAAGTRLAQVTFSNESASGWQVATFASPVTVTAGTTYIASYFAPAGRYSHTNSGLSAAIDNPPLQALANSTSPNGVYSYGSTSTFPTSSYQAGNYFVDVMFAVPVPGTVTGVTAVTGGQTSATVSWTAPSTGGGADNYKITPYVGATAQTATTVPATKTSTRVTGLTTGTTYTFTVQALNGSGGGTASVQSNSVTPSAPIAPSAPSDVLARPASNSAQLTWTAPDSDGDSPITGYTITPYIGATAQTPVTSSGTGTSKTVTGLTNGAGYTFKVAATNAIGTGAASDPSNSITPQFTILDFATPTTVDSGDVTPVELGVKFTADSSGSITGIRFYKAAANTGTHVGSLWNAAGTRLAQATFTNESATGWQTVTFASPIAITANTTYVASYLAPAGHYSVTAGALATGVDNPPLHAVSNATSPNGVYLYGAAGGFPTGSFNAGNYGVDVLFVGAPAPGAPTGVTATAGQGSANVSWTAPSTGGAPSAYKITPYIGAAAQTATTITGTPPATSTTIAGLTSGTAHTFKVEASNLSGTGPASAASNSVTPTAATAPAAPTGVTALVDAGSAVVSWTAPSNGGSPITGHTVTPYIGATAQTPVTVGASTTSTRVSGLTNGTAYTFKVKSSNAVGTGPDSAASAAVSPAFSLLDYTTPGTTDSGDGGSVNLGVKFTADSNGTIAGIRFYKATTNTGTHVGTLWTAAGAQLGQVTFTGESASGWQTARFASPISITAGTTYVVSYLAPSGHYAVTGGAFGSGPLDSGPLHALANVTSQNGVFAYGATSTFPTGSFNAANYWVDVLYAPTGS